MRRYREPVDPVIAQQLAARSADLLTAWHPGSAEQRALRDEYLAFIEHHGPDAVRKPAGPEHLTASCFLFTEDRAHVLLTLHRKAGRWLQLGGHYEPADADPAEAALREALEEGGVPGATLVGLADLDRHELVGAFGACRVHWDLGFLATVPAASAPVISDESDDVRWFRIDELADAAPDVARRLAPILA
ncbi:NUDIX hydrolase [Arenivirga flava]|uniref:NUDIX hydrolase n=1 Tax=Arenivirga flava TaxID=1930060 RepID=A0AA37UHJ9_9MICO|nr:NUDIX hydrolase [Arenivirga flava]